MLGTPIRSQKKLVFPARAVRFGGVLMTLVDFDVAGHIIANSSNNSSNSNNNNNNNSSSNSNNSSAADGSTQYGAMGNTGRCCFRR